MAKKGVRMIPIIPDKLFERDTAKAFVAINNAMRDTLADGVRFISDYPTQQSGSRYRRTGILRRSWEFIMKTGGRRIEGAVQSNSRIAPYNREVQGEDQTSFFKGRQWPNVKELAKRMSKDLSKKVQKALGSAFR